MNDILYTALGLLIPFFGTALGSLSVYFFNKTVNDKFRRLMLGFASGVMIAAGVWSLIMPAIEMYEGIFVKWVPASIGFLLGMAFLSLSEDIMPRIQSFDIRCKPKTELGKNNMLVFAVTLHNFPEGMAVGVLFASYLNGLTGLIGAFAFAVGIAIQNIPEGAVISLPLAADGMNKTKAFVIGVLSGLAEPLGAILTIMFINLALPALPYILSFAAGAMMYVVIEELIPESQNGSRSNIGTLGTAIGFTLMMILDVALG